ENYAAANPTTRSLIWRGMTQSKKLSLFAEDFFRRIAAATGSPMLLRKTDLYRLIELQSPGEIDPEVTEKLDAVQSLLQRQDETG
ncbi:MAG: AAA family ATPase, partial [Cyanobacteriota bacterium]|nr:AAA family ATPase [Cyanobacteriota bacterium]